MSPKRRLGKNFICFDLKALVGLCVSVPLIFSLISFTKRPKMLPQISLGTGNNLVTKRTKNTDSESRNKLFFQYVSDLIIFVIISSQI